MSTEERAPVGVDTTRPSVARVYDYMLGGKDNFAVDRQAGQMALQVTPDGPLAARANRGFLRRAVRHLVAEAGVRQFLDIGSGLPTQGNVHEIAHQVDPQVRVVYVDSDPMVLAHGRALLDSSPMTTVVQADTRDPGQILANPDVQSMIDMDQPVGLLMLGILHHLGDDEDPAGVATVYRDAVPSGSYLALSHFHNPGDSQPEAARKAFVVEKIFNQTLGTGRWRQRDEILGYFGDFEMLEPGLVPLAQWRPDPDDEPSEQTDTYYTFVGGVARKP
ncbi:SAM-dependent methyltransferase [Solwaraspora sp. WMMD937]|uniref:SAM-dependent methyltransferase n=1 Tax=Solwaraspora sp. WMMD937 TaxID=3016090 RepID=UPI00249CB9DD|nr:SAM-dependent methyltransferase [Solwaraspora sp. WMMD937]WFE19589.1 SAM-dependent methyltransferase [Solwaraspora sp. WMMD937]